ncbi:cell division cycle and apoptosis regulator protein 1-like [Patella vulgata]|uniref:cell division cycle and apoptosis regulator protein 1-like n=1 Tax=Patella vulgata TaxID=6465 RepID=UPI0021804D7E|nr:cell division cycle and apoptosis regulator protein 1-like [Patella vulgata]
MASQFGAAKNPPWARPPADYMNANQATSMTQNQLSQAQQLGNTIMVPGNLGNPTVYSLGSNNPSLGTQQYNAALNAVNLQQQQAANALPPPQAVLPQPGIATPTSLASHQVPTVSYPAPRVAQPQTLPQGMKQRVFTGTVTKLHDTFGFVDEEVFFQMTSVKGNQPKVGERVLVEAAFNASMPFKWNATRIQLLPGQQPQGVNVQPTMKSNIGMGQILHSNVNANIQPTQMSMNAVPPPPLMSHGANDYRSGILSSQGSSSRMGPNQPPIHRSEPNRFSSMKDREKHADRERERRDRDRIRDVRRKRSPPRHSRSPVRSPPRKRAPSSRSTPRYVVQIPKLSLNLKNANVVMLKTRYSNMYIPSDFFYTDLRWNDAFPLERPFKLGNTCNFHIMDKDVESISPNKTPLDPPDVDHAYVAKVMLLSSASLEDLYHKSCGLAEDPPDVQEAFQHPTRLLQFLVGVRGKNEPMAIGGTWSPSLDGADPAGDPQVLINTAIRTTKALTGIDLSSCTKWYRFAEICYLRPAGSHKGRQLDDRVETVVIFMPDVWMCTPSRIEWEELQSAYSKQLQTKIASSPDPKDPGTQALLII